MQTQPYLDDNGHKPGLVISKNQSVRSVAAHAVVRDAVDAWQKTLPGKAQETIAQLVVDEWRRRSGRGLQLGDSVRNNKQNLFRWLDNPFNSMRYAGYIEQLAPVICDVMPIEIARQHGLKKGKTEAELVAASIKECADIHQAKLLGATHPVLEKEVKEGIAALLRLIPPDSWGPVLNGVTSVLGKFF